MANSLLDFVMSVVRDPDVVAWARGRADGDQLERRHAPLRRAGGAERGQNGFQVGWGVNLR